MDVNLASVYVFPTLAPLTGSHPAGMSSRCSFPLTLDGVFLRQVKCLNPPKGDVSGCAFAGRGRHLLSRKNSIASDDIGPTNHPDKRAAASDNTQFHVPIIAHSSSPAKRR